MVTCRRLGKLGGWGNQLFQYAGTRLYAELNGFSYVFPRWQGNNIFQNIRSYTAREYLISRFLPTCQLDDLPANTPLERVRHAIYGYRLPHTIPLADLYEHPRDNINIYGYLQEKIGIRMLLCHKERVHKWFAPQNNIENAIKDATKNIGPYIGVHIRRGDWVRLGIAPPIEPIKEMIEKMRGNRRVIVCSDSPAVIHLLEPIGITRVVSPLTQFDPAITDFMLLRNAATVIGSGSTFSWWAAYLGGQNDYYAPSNHAWDTKKGFPIHKHDLNVFPAE